MSVDDLELLPALALLAGGAAAVALEPRNRAARLIALAGSTGLASYLVTPLATAHDHSSLGASLIRQTAELSFLLLSASLASVLLVFPEGRWARPWHRLVSRTVFALALAAPLLQLIGSARLVGNGSESTAVDNVLAVPRLRVLGVLGELITQVEPAWFVIGMVIFALRFRAADPEGRRGLRPLLLAVILLGVLLVGVLAEEVGGFSWPQPAFQLVFLLGLSAVPFLLLAGISRRSRRLAAELAASRGRLLVAEDEARRRLERDLHDGVQQQLVALLSVASLAGRQAAQGNPAVRASLDDLRSQLTETIQQLRELVNGIRPPALSDAGVAAALESRMRLMPAEVTMDVADVRDRRWSIQTETAAYYVACEAVANALKHAPGAPVLVRLADLDGALQVEIVDEGPGLPSEPTTGTGLLGLRDRVESIGGALSVSPGATVGTVVRAVFAT